MDAFSQLSLLPMLTFLFQGYQTTHRLVWLILTLEKKPGLCHEPDRLTEEHGREGGCAVGTNALPGTMISFIVTGGIGF